MTDFLVWTKDGWKRYGILIFLLITIYHAFSTEVTSSPRGLTFVLEGRVFIDIIMVCEPPKEHSIQTDKLRLWH